MTKCEMLRLKGTRVNVELPEKLEEYAKNFLILFNNYRDNKAIHYLMNYEGNTVTVVVEYEINSSSYEFFKLWISQLGTITHEETCYIHKAYIDDSGIDKDIMSETDCELSLKNEWI
ncbi:MAG: hypothetical protein E7391_09165 [Ruminococcaceae bacterium]|nr:hypothetical protein [Oscillospiraceae bacterium]